MSTKEELKGIDLTPREIVAELDRYIISQTDAKRAVAVALRSRWRRMQLKEPLRSEVLPNNIMLIGPTGVGKTEIARRLAKLAGAPFIKIEATKFTEVGYVGRDIESIIRELADISVKMVREQARKIIESKAQKRADERVLDILLPQSHDRWAEDEDDDDLSSQESSKKARDILREKMLAGELDEKEIEVKISSGSTEVEIMGPAGMEELTSQLRNMFQTLSSRKKNLCQISVKKARERLCEEEASELINESEIREQAIKQLEQNGIVFLDEIDKIARRGEYGSGNTSDVSREGVQRDLLPLVEGSSVTTKYGIVRTDHILFIASGAFHLAKPSDLVPELQGRFPIRVELKSLTDKDFIKILTEPHASLTQQYIALLATEGVELQFVKSGIDRIAKIAYEVNERTENIGARRLRTIMEKLLENISFSAMELKKKKVVIHARYVDKQLAGLSKDDDLSRYIL